MVTAAEAEAILAEPKVIAVNFTWRRQPRGYQLEATVMAMESQQTLRLLGYIGRKNRSFALLYQNTPIRKYTVHDRHRDPVTKEVIREPHKHQWNDEWQDRKAYIPDDIRIGDPNIELIDFFPVRRVCCGLAAEL